MASAEHLRALVTRLAPGDGVDRHDLERLTVPDTAAARRAEEICREAQSESLANHCFRSYGWGALLGDRDGLRLGCGAAVRRGDAARPRPDPCVRPRRLLRAGRRGRGARGAHGARLACAARGDRRRGDLPPHARDRAGQHARGAAARPRHRGRRSRRPHRRRRDRAACARARALPAPWVQGALHRAARGSSPTEAALHRACIRLRARCGGAHPRRGLRQLAAEPRDQLTPAAHAGLPEDRLQVILHRVLGDAHRAGELLRRETVEDERGELTLAPRQVERRTQQIEHLVRC